MKLSAHKIGQEGHTVLVIDEVLPDPDRFLAMVKALGPFEGDPSHDYPGLRRFVSPHDHDTQAYVMELLSSVADLLIENTDMDGFEAIEASFSMMTQPPAYLSMVQRMPHYDGVAQNLYAVLHFLNPKPHGGTAFYRHKATGFEQINAERKPLFLKSLEGHIKDQGPLQTDYIFESNDVFEKIAHFEGLQNRLLVYRGNILHSGYVHPDFDFSQEITEARLTGNLFIKSNEAP